MKKSLIACAAAAAVLPLCAQAQSASASPEVVEKDARGVAAKVRVEGKVYDVCRGEATDGCINPREAGLNFGNRPLDHYPEDTGQEMPAS
ncbi:MAG: hypothetical protein VYD90_18245 [Pseudomonadota bacterium]|uniref:hypothetical protein n=1 Tax=Novosphingobium sp. MBES04 TaxID=1206458 RepID=UPI00057C4112|nr:hypothetical protein [Novosphingobium sp. MBES04]MED5547179.1 hypothetical protein [Pseudomonadota bacterium]